MHEKSSTSNLNYGLDGWETSSFSTQKIAKIKDMLRGVLEVSFYIFKRYGW